MPCLSVPEKATHVNIRLEHAVAAPRPRDELQAVLCPASLHRDSIEVGRAEVPAVLLRPERHHETIGRYGANDETPPCDETQRYGKGEGHGLGRQYLLPVLAFVKKKIVVFTGDHS